MNKQQLEMAIYKRYLSLCAGCGVEPESKTDFLMTLFFADDHVGIDLERLLGFDDFSFSHDVFGMLRHMNRGTCKLENLFLPRCSKPQTSNV